jgi:NAD dependent epimerase/dehydratase family enzyme
VIGKGRLANSNQLGIRVVIIKWALYWQKREVLKAVVVRAKWGLGAALGSGKMTTSWIHIDDLCGVFIKAGIIYT